MLNKKKAAELIGRLYSYAWCDVNLYLIVKLPPPIL
ncbi:hypothetical protein FHS68_000497 [Dyadobacter arcticus]|uniref:Uncharacterized protein n=1 Tax=Dyadobacter arcticus TaxID=1078754 RepID=A0ABX0UEC8_9BACT|nr:hypothetical protein [Dyadobacter arcticus]